MTIPVLKQDLIHISGDSPCLDAGTNWVVDESDKDIDGQVRILGFERTHCRRRRG